MINCYDLKFDQFFAFKHSQYSLRCHKYQIPAKNSFKDSQWTNSFFFRTPTLWNRLPEHAVNADSIQSFKLVLKSHLFSKQ